MEEREQLIEIIADVPSATATYGVRDDHGATMDTLKVIENPEGGYLAVYHTGIGNGRYAVHVATSADLTHWTRRARLGEPASQPTVAATPGGGFLVVVEAGRDHAPTGLRFSFYPDLERLLGADPSRVFDAPHQVAPAGRLSEGTPNVYDVSFAPDADHSTIDVGFHFWRPGRLLRLGDVDRQARGTLTGFSQWHARPEPGLDAAIEAFGAKGNIGGREQIFWHGRPYLLIEGQLRKRDWRSWRLYLYDPATGAAYPIAVRTHGGSLAFANPTATLLTAPTGGPALLITLHLFHEGAAPGEAGPLLYYRSLDPSRRDAR